MKAQHIIIATALIFPLIAKLYEPTLFSLSMMWEHEVLKYGFVCMNIFAALTMGEYKKWRIPGTFLILLTAFNISEFETIHLILAIGFFLACLRAFYVKKRFRHYAWLFCVSIGVYFALGLYWAEYWAICIICIYHLDVLQRIKKLKL